MHVLPIEDELDRDPGILERGNDRTWRAMPDARHRIEGVSEQTGADIEGGAGQLKVGFRVTDRHHDLVLHEDLDELQRVGQFGRDRQLPQRAVRSVEQAVEFCGLRVPQEARIVRTPSCCREVRTLEVGTQHEWIRRGNARDGRQALLEGCDGGRDQAQHRPRRSMRPMDRERPANRVHVIVVRETASAV